MNAEKHEIIISFNFDAREDGRTYVYSPDLTGFHFLLEENEEPLEAMKDTLKIHLKHTLGIDMLDIRYTPSVHEYRARKMEIPPLLFPKMYMAEIA